MSELVDFSAHSTLCRLFWKQRGRAKGRGGKEGNEKGGQGSRGPTSNGQGWKGVGKGKCWKGKKKGIGEEGEGREGSRGGAPIGAGGSYSPLFYTEGSGGTFLNR